MIRLGLIGVSSPAREGLRGVSGLTVLAADARPHVMLRPATARGRHSCQGTSLLIQGAIGSV